MTTKRAKSKATRQDLKSLYETRVLDGIRSWRDKRGPDTSDDHGFLLWAFDLILEASGSELTDEQVIQACERDKSGDLKIDGGYIDHETEKIFLVQAKNWDPTKLVGDDPFFQTWESLDLLSDPKRIEKANLEAKEFYAEFAPAVQTGYSVVLCVATSGRVGPEQKDYVAKKPKVREIPVGAMTYPVHLRFEIFDLPKLLEIEAGDSEEGGPSVESPVVLEFDGGHYITPGDDGGLYRSLYATIPAQALVELRSRLKDSLYRLNFRGPLDTRVAVNKEILTTLQKLPGLFHVLNNGVTAICQRFEPEAKTNTAKVWEIQVVNGCQTTETLFRNSNMVIGHPEVKVNFRLVECVPAQAGLVAKATNQQTRLRAEDFVTLEPIQNDLQQQFARMSPRPWYYEIKRRYWKNVMLRDNKREAARYTVGETGERVIVLRDAAQRSLAFLGQPIVAAQKTADIFKPEAENGYKEKVFPPRLSAYQLLLPWSTYVGVKSGVQVYLKDLASDEDRKLAKVWLENGRLTVLGLVGDALRDHYQVPPLEYFRADLSKKLVESMNDWVTPIIKLGLGSIWNSVKNQTDLQNRGARSVFRRTATYDSLLKPTFLSSFQTLRNEFTRGLPPD